MFPVGSFSRMKNDLWLREYEKGTDIPITVGILIADYRRSFCKENVLNQLERFDKKSGPLIDFYIPGYCKTSEIDEHYADKYRFKNQEYSFSPKYFNEFIDELEKRNIRVTGRTQLLLIPYEHHHLLFDQAISFDLESDESGNKIESTKLFFESIFQIASETTAFEIFKARINHDRASNWFFGFLKEKLPDAILSLIMSPFQG